MTRDGVSGRSFVSFGARSAHRFPEKKSQGRADRLEQRAAAQRLVTSGSRRARQKEPEATRARLGEALAKVAGGPVARGLRKSAYRLRQRTLGRDLNTVRVVPAGRATLSPFRALERSPSDLIVWQVPGLA